MLKLSFQIQGKPGVKKKKTQEMWQRTSIKAGCQQSTTAYENPYLIFLACPQPPNSPLLILAAPFLCTASYNTSGSCLWKKLAKPLGDGVRK